MAISNGLKNQITNRNFLSNVGFQLILNRAPKVAFFGNGAQIPGISLGAAIQPTGLKDIDVPGDKVQFDDFRVRFLVDENLENYMEIHHWIRGCGYPDSLMDIYDRQFTNPGLDVVHHPSLLNLFCDGTLNILTSANNPSFKVVFRDLWPTYLSQLDFNATDPDLEYLTAEVSFKYTIYDIVTLGGEPLHYAQPDQS